MSSIGHIVYKTGDARHWTPKQLMEHVLVEMNREGSKFANCNKAVLILAHEDTGERTMDYYRFFSGCSKQEGIGIIFQNGIVEATELK